jgi:Cys-tRNA(Pro)/Cys-tRNA(Cys) deacylase
MTPAIHIAQKIGIDYCIHEYKHDPGSASYGEEAANKMGIDSKRIFKTLLVSVDGKNLSVAVLPVSCQLDLKRYAKLLGAKKATMADKKDVERVTGYVLGGVSPLGQKRKLNTVIDRSATVYDTIFISAGRRGLEIELSPTDQRELAEGEFGDICK